MEGEVSVTEGCGRPNIAWSGSFSNCSHHYMLKSCDVMMSSEI
jgi:hypothetical protein